MRHPGGYATLVDPDRPLVEHDTCTCGHCQRVIFTKPGSASTIYLLPVKPKDSADLAALGRFREERGAFCRICMRPICLPCYDRSLTARVPCVVWERRLERSEARDRLRRQALGGHG